MERNYYTEGFEGFLKEKADQHKLYPSQRVWKSINRQLHPRSNWPYLTVMILLVVGIGITGKLYLNGGKFTAADASANAGLKMASLPIPENSFPSTLIAREKSPIAKVSTALVTNRSTNLPVNAGNAEGSVFSLSVIALPETVSGDHGERLLSPQTTEFVRVISSPPLNFDANKSSLQETSASPDQDNSTIEKNLALKNLTKSKWEWQLYLSPTVSYRKLSGSASKVPYSYSGIAYSANFGYPSDVNDAVTHTPSIGMELGTAMVYNISPNFRFKAGIQFNYNQYHVKAYDYNPELAPYGLNPNGFISAPLTVVSHYRNFDGYTPTWLKNEHFMVSTPVGLELGLMGNAKIQFSIAGSLQPTYILNNKAFLISTNLKNYAEESSLYRKWNINSAIETFLSINTGSVKWVVGPQFRYQLLSSYKNKYPIKEHLLDYGIKVGVNKTLK